MTRGRKPLPPEVHEKTGAYEKNPQRRRNDLPPALKDEPIKPDTVSADDIASKKWDELAGTLRSMKLLSASYADMMESYCVTFSVYRRALAVINKAGVLIRQDGSKAVRNPISVELHKCLDRMAKLQAEMGMTPASRSRISTGQSQSDADPVLEFLKRRAESRN